MKFRTLALALALSCGFTSTAAFARKTYKAKPVKIRKNKRFKNSKAAKVKPRKGRKAAKRRTRAG